MKQVRIQASVSRRANAPGAFHSGLDGAVLSSATLLLVSCSVVGSLLFTLTYLVEGITRPGYDAWQQANSLLSLGPGGWVQQVNFVVFGVLMLCSAFGWRKVLKGGRAATWFPLLRGLAGLSLILVGIFSQDPVPGYPPDAVMTAPTFHAVIHVVFSFVAITSLAFSAFVIARRFAVEPRWRGWASYSVITGLRSFSSSPSLAHRTEIAERQRASSSVCLGERTLSGGSPCSRSSG